MSMSWSDSIAFIEEKGLIRDMDTADLMDYGRELLQQTKPSKGLTSAVYSEYLQRTGRNLYEATGICAGMYLPK